MREHKRFVIQNGRNYGVPSMKVENEVVRSHTGLVRLYFDAVYQEPKYGRSVDMETVEVVGEEK